MRRYNQQLYRIGVSWLGTEDMVEDVMQNTYLKAWFHLPQFKGEAAFSTWLIRIMINECKQVIRRKEKERIAYLCAAKWSTCQRNKRPAAWRSLLKM